MKKLIGFEEELISLLESFKKNTLANSILVSGSKGIGKSLMDFSEEYAQENGFKSVRLDTFSQNKRNNKFYKSRQYVKLSDVFFPMQSEFPFHCYEKIIN